MENETINIGGANNGGNNGGNNNLPPNMGFPMDDEFKTPTEEVALPSKGAFYPGQKSTVKVKYLTAEEDNILFSPELIKNGKVLDVLLESAVLDKDLRPDDMVSGDRNYLLIEIRKTGFGNEYKPGEIMCPECGQFDRPVVNLDLLKPRLLEQMPNEKGEYELELPVTKMIIKFRLLRGSDEKRLSKTIESGNKKGNVRVSKLVTERYLLQIMEVNGNRDKTYISRFISAMPTKDSLFFREYNRQIEPGIDLNYTFECPHCGNFHEQDVPINSKLFYPESK